MVFVCDGILSVLDYNSTRLIIFVARTLRGSNPFFLFSASEILVVRGIYARQGLNGGGGDSNTMFSYYERCRKKVQKKKGATEPLYTKAIY